MYGADLESSIEHKKIQLDNELEYNNQAIKSSNQEISNNLNNPNTIKDTKQMISQGIISQAMTDVTNSWYEKFLNFTFINKYYNITTGNIFNRLYNALIPFNYKFHEMIQENPDIYGPIWIYTTLIFVIAAAGSITQIFSDTTDVAFFENFVPVAAFIIYGVGFIIPIILTILMKCFGSETTFVLVLCIFGYSFTIYLPAIAICAVPYDWLQWLLIGYAVISSGGFLIVNFWKELSKYIQNRMYIILGIIIGFEVVMFFYLKIYFFNRFTKALPNPSNVTLTNSNSTSHHYNY